MSAETYNLRWRNTLVENVDWNGGKDEAHKVRITYRFVIDDHVYSSPISFDCGFDIDTSEDVQFIKMQMDRHLVQVFKGAVSIERDRFEWLKEYIYKYIVNIFDHPYKWTPTL